MSRHKSSAPPTYRLHRPTKQAVVTLSDAFGRRHDVYLGQHGTAASRKEYARVLSEWETSGRSLPVEMTGSDTTVAELILRFMTHAKSHYNGSREVDNFRESLRPLQLLYGSALVNDFGPLSLQAIRDMLIRGYDHPRYGHQAPLARTTINNRIARIKAVFKWGTSQQIVPASVFHALQSVRGLQVGRSEARETEAVKPVPIAFVRKTIAMAPPVVQDMIELQLLTGMRSGELCTMRACNIDMGGAVWIYKPAAHKTAHRGHHRAVAIGPKGQAIVRRHLTAKIDAFLFSPARQREMIDMAKRAARKSKVQPSQVNRKKYNPQVRVGERYTTNTYAIAVKRAAEKAGVGHWHPHQLRHAKATELRRQFGLDAARTILGHRSPQITETYAELDENKAREIMAKIG